MNMMLSLLEEKIKTSKFNYLEALYFMNEFTFGFELEGWALSPSLKDDFNYYASKYFNNLENNLPKHKKTINTSTMELGLDSTIKPNEEDAECSNCEGTGFVSCEHCEGEGKIECGECDGSGEIEVGKKCEFCKGTGRDLNYVKGLFNDKITCPECNGEGENYRIKICPECDGEGHKNCHTCDGDGRMECPYCYNGKVDMEEHTYEWKSPIFNFNMENIQHVIKFLYSCLEKSYLRTNDSCGFHVHVGLPDKLLLNENRLWILIKLALKDNGNFVKKFFIYKTNNYDIYFTDSTYADTNIIQNIQRKIKNVNTIEDIYLIMKNAYSDEKFTVLGQHPQGTLEWRGPRGFLDTGDTKIIKGFFLNMLYPLIKFFNDAMEETSLVINDVSISKKDFDLYVKKTLGYMVKIDRGKRLKDRRFNWDWQEANSNLKYINELLKSNKWLLKLNFQNINVLKEKGKYIISNGSFLDNSDISTSDIIFSKNNFNNCSLYKNIYDGVSIDECNIYDGIFTNSDIQSSNVFGGNFDLCTFNFQNYIGKINGGYFKNCMFVCGINFNIKKIYENFKFENMNNCELLLKGTAQSDSFFLKYFLVKIDHPIIKIPNAIKNIDELRIIISNILKERISQNKNEEDSINIKNFKHIELDESFKDYIITLHEL